MKLSEAIRLGAMLGKKMDGKLYDGYGGGGSCAVGSALLALGLIAHLNNKTKRPQDSHQPHDWTREQIADWVETIEAQHDVKSADIAVAVTV